jgi:hypothetical protein
MRVEQNDQGIIICLISVQHRIACSLASALGLVVPPSKGFTCRAKMCQRGQVGERLLLRKRRKSQMDGMDTFPLVVLSRQQSLSRRDASCVGTTPHHVPKAPIGSFQNMFLLDGHG